MTSIFKRKGRKGWTLKYQPVTGGPPRFEQKPTRQACEDRALELRQAPQSSRFVLFRDYAATWLARTKQHVRPGTLHVYSSNVAAHLGPAFGHLPIRDLTKGAVKDFIAGKLATLSRSYVASIVRTLHAMLAEAKEDGLIFINPADSRRGLGPGGKAQKQIKALDAVQLRKLLAATEPRWWMLFRLMSLTGLRIGEALALRWEDVDLAGRTVRVQRGWTRAQIQPTKSGKERVVDMAAPLVAELQRHDAAQKAAGMKTGRRTEWLFPATRGDQPTDHTKVALAFKRALKAAGLPQHFTPHCLRHTCATILLQRGKSIYYVQGLLGHSSISMTVDKYGSSLPRGDRGAVDDLAAFLDEVTSEVTGQSAKKRKTR